MLFNEASGCEDGFGSRPETEDADQIDWYDYEDNDRIRSHEMVKRWVSKEPPAGIDCLAVWNAAHAEYRRLQEAGENARMCDVFGGVFYKALAASGLEVRRG